MTSRSQSTADAAETGEAETAGAADGDESGTTNGVLPESADLTIPATANHGEAAAIAAAVGAHVNDRAAAGTASEDATEQCNRWKLCGRLRGRTPPREVARGEEWKAAGRARW